MTPEEVRAIRQRVGLTQAGLARICGVGGQTVMNWEKGRTPIEGPAAKILRMVEPIYRLVHAYYEVQDEEREEDFA